MDAPVIFSCYAPHTRSHVCTQYLWAFVLIGHVSFSITRSFCKRVENGPRRLCMVWLTALSYGGRNDPSPCKEKHQISILKSSRSNDPGGKKKMKKIWEGNRLLVKMQSSDHESLSQMRRRLWTPRKQKPPPWILTLPWSWTGWESAFYNWEPDAGKSTLD